LANCFWSPPGHHKFSFKMSKFRARLLPLEAPISAQFSDSNRNIRRNQFMLASCLTRLLLLLTKRTSLWESARHSDGQTPPTQYL